MNTFGSHALANLGILGLNGARTVWWNLTTAQLYEQSIGRGEARLAHGGPIVVRTGSHTGRSPKDKYIVSSAETEANVWWGPHNGRFTSDKFDDLLRRMQAYVADKDLFVQDVYAGADAGTRLPVRVVTETAWHSLFAHTMFIRPQGAEADTFEPGFTVFQLPYFHADPERDGTHSDVFVIINFERKLVLIGGTQYAGEIKKSVFTIMNYLLPRRGVLSMHASANIGPDGDSAVFFGLSGTGKTTLSADASRRLIGDDEHGWSDSGIFNLEGGCYAKVIHLSEAAEPEIFSTTHRFGTILENVAMRPDGTLDLDDAALTENTRAAYPLDFIDNAEPSKQGAHPRTIIMLTCDAFGVLPPIARLTPQQAMYQFLSGYTAKVAGTEAGVTEPTATFSPCFGAPFMALRPAEYAHLLGDRIAKHDTRVYLINTGWFGGGYGVGQRIPIQATRALVNAALSGALDTAPTRLDPTFGFEVPLTVPGVQDDLLDPRRSWPDVGAYDARAADLARRFTENFRLYAGDVSPAVRAAGPVGTPVPETVPVPVGQG
jgi:phosphoenolpyruvate carboxykinase (ATP)